MNKTIPESATIEEQIESASMPRRRGGPRRQAFVKVNTVSAKRPPLPDPRWMAEFIAAFLKASR